MSRRSVTSASTLHTVDDVLSHIDLKYSAHLSLKKYTNAIKECTKHDDILRSTTINEVQDLSTVLSPVSANPNVLIDLMGKYNVILGGPQATSFFYPVCEPEDYPWDFYCPLDNADEFSREYKVSSQCDWIEDTGANTKSRVIYLRRTSNAQRDTCICNIRIFASLSHPVQCILDLQCTYEHTLISIQAAICFWPHLLEKNLYRRLDANPGHKDFPRGNTKYRMKIYDLSLTHMKKAMNSPIIYNGIEKRVESIVFPNSRSMNEKLFDQKLTELRHIVYCVYNSSMRYLGTTAEMK